MASTEVHGSSAALADPVGASSQAGDSPVAADTSSPVVTKPSTSALETREAASPIGSDSAQAGDAMTESLKASPTEPQQVKADVISSSAAADEEPAALGTETPRDPKVEQLRALFPNVDLEIIETVLAASGGSLDEATEQLLILSDPSYKPDPVEMSQLEADEEFARQLAQEEEAVAAEQRRQRAAARQAAGAASNTTASDGVSRPLAYQPYVPRARRGTTNSGMSALSPSISPSSTSWEPPAQAEQQRDNQSSEPRGRTAQDEIQEELAEIGEQISKFAEQGKKTFSSLFSKVKEGVAKMDDAIVRSASPPSQSTQASAPPPLPRKDTYSPFPSPSLASGSSPASRPLPANTTLSVVPDKLPRPDSYTSTRSLSPVPPPAAAGAAPAVASSSGLGVDAKDPAKAMSPSTLKPVAVPGFLPRQSFSLLDADKNKSSGGSTKGTTEDSSKNGDAKDQGDGADANGKRTRKESSGLLSAPNHRLEDSDDDDELEYSRSPFEDDD